MAHYAHIDKSGTVTRVIVAEADFVQSLGGTWVQTSYNTRGGIHYDQQTGEPSADQSKALRKNYAGVGYTYDAQLDAFIPPRPYPSWTLDDASCTWCPPTPMPQDGTPYTWVESHGYWRMVS